MPAILIVEDEPAIADTLIYTLRTEGFEPVWHGTGREALAAIEARPFALIILDVGLPDANGFELCKIIRARSSTPILFLTARNDEIDRIVGLEIGGDDYVTKPFSPREVGARVKAILRRARPVAAGDAPGLSAAGADAISIAPSAATAAARPGLTGRMPVPPSAAAAPSASVPPPVFEHDSGRCEIRFHGARLELTRYEYRLLKTLLARPGRVFSRDELMTQAWEDPGASLDRTVDAHIKTLRSKLRASSSGADPIQTHRGMGYSLRET